jgi:hypothetical protein
MGLLMPAIDELARIEFAEAEVTVETDASSVSIRAQRSAGTLTLHISGIALVTYHQTSLAGASCF